MNNNIRLILRAKQILKDATPMPFDCGQLCGGLCCKGSASDGMLLFPDEEYLYINNSDFSIISTADGNIKLLTCKGYCDRDTRPLSCMLYPVFPQISEADDRVEIRLIPDIRGSLSCPLICSDYYISRTFERAVRRAARCLITSPEHREFIDGISEEMLEIYELRKMLTKQR